MNKADLIASLMETFVEEVAEHVESFNRDLLALEADGPDTTELLRSLFRTAHNLKGASRAVAASDIENACHSMEEVLAGARDGTRALDAAAFAFLFETADQIQAEGRRLRKPEAPPPAAPAAAPSPLPSASPNGHEERGESLRVTAQKLDAVLARSGELLLAVRQTERRRTEWTSLEAGVASVLADVRVMRAMPAGSDQSGAARRVEAAATKLKEHVERVLADAAAGGQRLARTGSDLDTAVRGLRMIPFAEATQGLERAIRDLALDAGKDVAFRLGGDEVELDRAVAERLRDPLLHLVRNAVDHGIEPPPVRVAAGKAAQGVVTVSAQLRGSQVEIEVGDDGRGLDRARIRDRALALGIGEPADDRELLALVFHPGLTTAEAVTSVSGRGVGLDVVKSQVNGLHGTVGLESTPGQGTVFTITVPLTVTLIRALLVEASGGTFALATTQVMGLRRLVPDDVRTVGGREMLAGVRGLLPLVSLAEALGLPLPTRSRGQGGLAVLVEAGTTRVAFVVDEVVSEQDLVVTGLGPRLRNVPNVAGCALLEDGGIAIILSTAELAEHALRATGQHRTVLPPAPVKRQRVLVADDSVTTRTLEKSILEEAGYDVTLAADGHQAWRILQSERVDLLVADVEMPGMDGFTLTALLRRSQNLARLPVVLVTSLSSEQDRARGLQVGADAYLVKSGFERRGLLDAVGQLL